MMNIPPSEAKALTMWEYTALMHHWNEAHNSDPKPKTLEPGRRNRLERAMKANASVN